MYPLLLKPTVKDYLWGGTRLKTEFGFETDKEIAAEAWVLSTHKDGEDIVTNGEFKGKTLTEVLKIWGNDAIGERAAKFPYFPILIKLIDAKDKLSVQVHPDDKYALEKEGEFGKTEMLLTVTRVQNLFTDLKRKLQKRNLRKESRIIHFLKYVTMFRCIREMSSLLKQEHCTQ